MIEEPSSVNLRPYRLRDQIDPDEYLEDFFDLQREPQQDLELPSSRGPSEFNNDLFGD